MKEQSDVIRAMSRDFKGKNVYVIGLGLLGGGLGVTEFFDNVGASVTVTDKKSAKDLKPSVEALRDRKVNLMLGDDYLDDIFRADVIIPGTGVPLDLPVLVKAEQKGIKIETETEIFVRYLPAENPMIGITGTRGKSTTTQMIHNMLIDAGKRVHLGGNVANTSTINILNELLPGDPVVLELSSKRLEGFERAQRSPQVAVYTNLTPDHLDAHSGGMEGYAYAKSAIYRHQTTRDTLVAHHDLLNTVNPLLGRTPINKRDVRGKLIEFDQRDYPGELHYIQGEHNRSNAAAAYLVGVSLLGLARNQVQDSLAAFKGLDYRQQIIAQKGNVTFVNDSCSTMPRAVEVAIDAMQDQKIMLVMGGNSKGLPLDQFGLIQDQLRKVEKILLLYSQGSFTREIEPILSDKYPEKMLGVFDSLQEIVSQAYQYAEQLGEAVRIVFSPGATSFGMFKNEFDRGAQFTDAVNAFLKQL